MPGQPGRGDFDELADLARTAPDAVRNVPPRRPRSKRSNSGKFWAFAFAIMVITIVAGVVVAYLVTRNNITTGSSGDGQSAEAGNGGGLVSGLLSIGQKNSKVTVTATYKYNDYVGNKPDAGAVVFLLPESESMPGKINSVTLNTGELQGDAAKMNVQAGEIGGDGRYVFNRVRPGKYTILVMSKNTRDEMGEMHDLDTKQCEIWFENPIITGKVWTESIAVGSDEQLEYSHDFGITDF